VGVAACDALWTVASPVETVRRTKFTKDAARLIELIDGRDAGGLVVGLPVNMDGSEGPKCQSVRAFVRNLAQALAEAGRPRLEGLPMLLWDERWSTQAVTRTLLEADASRARRAEVVDKMAAAYILQGAIDRLANLSG
jgi:putative Holliday junction resolvase